METFQNIATLADLPAEGEARSFPCGTRTICVARIDGALTAIDDVCPHHGGPLGQGEIEGTHIICPWHGWQFDAFTGQSISPLNTSVDTFELKVEGETVLARKISSR
jgi:nitrite reductase/ring-hydroxylating ferredoxin subunit